MASTKLRILLCVIGIFVAVHAQNEANTLVLLDNLAIRETHSLFFKGLQDNGYKLTYKLADDANLVLSKYGIDLYKNLIIFAPSTDEFGGDINVPEITRFIDNGGNVLVGGSSHSGESLRDLAIENGFEIDEDGAAVIDHLNYDESDSGDHTTIVVSPDNLIKSHLVVGDKNIPPLLYQGTGLLADRDNGLTLQVLSANSTAYSYVPQNSIKEYPHAVGRGTVLVAALQARNNARVVYSGSLFFFSDKAFTSSVTKPCGETHAKSGNQQVATAIAKWAFGEVGRIRVAKVEHHLDGETETPSFYTITDPVVYTISIEELINGQWQPFVANDVQLEFVRIDPFVRTTLKHTGGGRYEARFQIPDVYGVYQFKVDYNRVGYTQLYSTTQISVRPLQHTQYERFIASAFPYYTSALSMMVGLFIFAFIFIHFKEPELKKHSDEKKKERHN